MNIPTASVIFVDELLVGDSMPYTLHHLAGLERHSTQE